MEVALSAKAESIHAIFSLALPIAFAIAGFFFAKPFSLFFFGKNASENFQAFCVFAFALLGGAFTLLISKIKRNAEGLEVKAIRN